MQQHINQAEIRVLALKRSGNHAIVQWILDNLEGRYCFVNNCRPGANPFLKDFITKHGRHGEKGYISNIPDFDVMRECRGEHCAKDYLIYSYEDRNFDEIEHPGMIHNHDLFLGASARRVDVMVLRDPYNNLASMVRMSQEKNRYLKHRLKRRIGVYRMFAQGIVGASPVPVDEFEAELIRARDHRAFVYRDAMRTAKLWIMYASELLGETKRFPGLVWINYNRWFSEPDYRQELASTLQLAGHDRGIDRVPTWGDGSSFDGQELDGRARHMKVLERWKQLQDDEIFRRVLRDQRIHDLSRRLFGAIPGTETLASDSSHSAPPLVPASGPAN